MSARYFKFTPRCNRLQLADSQNCQIIGKEEIEEEAAR